MPGLKPNSPSKPLSDLLRTPSFATVAVAVGVLVSAALLARTSAVPYSAAVVSAALPRIWDAARPWLAPPYLFATVHVIILIIWKLSEHRHHGDPRSEEEKPPPDFAVPISLVRKPSPEIPREISLPGPDLAEPVPNPGDPEASDEKSTSTETEVSVEMAMAGAGEPPMVAAEDDTMEARWKAIVEGGAAPVVKFTLPPEGGMVVVEAEDWNERFDAFIKKNYEQIRVVAGGG